MAQEYTIFVHQANAILHHQQKPCEFFFGNDA
jgi:hypothetical protein